MSSVDGLAQATLAVSAEGDQVGPSGSPSAGLDLATLEQYARIADGQIPLPGEPAPQAPANQYQAPAQATPQTPAQPSPLEQQLAVERARTQALEQMFLAQQQAQVQAQQQAPQVDPVAQRAAEMRAAGMDPTSREQQAVYELWRQNTAMQQQLAQVQQHFAALQQQAQVYTYQAQVAPQVDAAFQALGVQSVPAAVRQDVLARVIDGAMRGDQQALERAMLPYREFAGAYRPAPQAAPPPPRLAAVPPNTPGAPNPMDVVSLQGRGAGRSPAPVTLDEITRLVSRRG